MSMEMNKALDLLREIRPSIPKEVLELWCKDRDAFLASHPAVEQAGGDERVKCAVCVDSGKVYDISGEGPWKCYACTGSHEVIGYANGDELDNMLDDRTAVLSPVKTSFHTVPVYREARAALAQPSPKCATCNGTGQIVVSGPHYCGELQPPEYETEPCDMCSQPSPAQADEKPGDSILCYGCFAKGVGPDHFDEAGKCLAAQAEQAEAERPEVVAVMESNGAGGKRLAQRFPIVNVFVGDELMTVAQHERIVGELRTEIAMLRSYESEWELLLNQHEQERDSALARVEELDKQCRDDVARALGLRPSQERGFAWSYLLASIKSCVKASEDAAQAQHSVPEEWRDMLANLQWYYEPYDDHYHLDQGFYCPVCGGEKDEGHKQGCNLAKLIAAAPGNEGV